MPPPDNRALLAAVRAYLAANCPGCAFLYVEIHAEHLPVPIRLTDGPFGGRVSEEATFVPTPFQEAILDALEGKALRKQQLGAAVGDASRLYRDPGGLKELRDHGLVAHHSRLGYYRPDAPPDQLHDEAE